MSAVALPQTAAIVNDLQLDLESGGGACLGLFLAMLRVLHLLAFEYDKVAHVRVVAQLEHRFVVVRAQIGVGAVLEQYLDGLLVTPEGGHVQRRPAVVVATRERGRDQRRATLCPNLTLVEQKVEDGVVAVGAGYVHESSTVGVFGVKVQT